jgi:acetyl-CoA carboxylase / biotin carboxylase 1
VGTPILAPCPPLEALQRKRLAARRHKTTFCYDFPSVFGNALRQAWAARLAAGEPDSVPPAGGCFLLVTEMWTGGLPQAGRSTLASYLVHWTKLALHTSSLAHF